MVNCKIFTRIKKLKFVFTLVKTRRRRGMERSTFVPAETACKPHAKTAFTLEKPARTIGAKRSTFAGEQTPHMRSAKLALAFTLAETLITLAIIGVVAAMTIPGVLHHHRKTVIETRMERFYALYNEAINLAQIDHGSYMDWTFPTGNSTKEEVQYFHDTYIKPYIKTLRSELVLYGNSYRVIDYLLDGSAVVNSTTSSWLFIPDAKDVLPSQYEYEVRDDEEVSTYLTTETSGIKWFTFMFNPISSNTKYYNKGLVPYDYENSTLEGLKENNSLGCKKSTTLERAYCARVIQLNGWKIPDDYFYKF